VVREREFGPAAPQWLEQAAGRDREGKSKHEPGKTGNGWRVGGLRI
jgi:hypothetical protein